MVGGRFKDLTGQTFGELAVTRYLRTKTYPSGQTATVWLCKCSCGNECESVNRQLISGIKVSCGHLHQRPRIKTHGESHAKNETAEYRAWKSMKRRCYNKSTKDYAQYGRRGIRVSKRWLISYDNFIADMGRKPGPAYSLERVDHDDDYKPSNCRWATSVEQANNKTNTPMITYGGKTQSVADWARELGCGYFQLYDRLRPRRGFTVEEAFTPFVSKKADQTISP